MKPTFDIPCFFSIMLGNSTSSFSFSTSSHLHISLLNFVDSLLISSSVWYVLISLMKNIIERAMSKYMERW